MRATLLKRLWAPAVVAAGLALLLVRTAGDVGGKPLFEDEAVAGLVGARPVQEILGTVLWDRGGSPLHFLLVHLAFLVHASPATLRWLSVAFAVAAVVVAYDLGRRLGGELAGAVAALVTAGSGLLAVYASFGRMYSLLALAGALAGDTFVRALRERTAGSAALAAGAAWLLPATHPYGGIVAAVELAIALWIWRGRPWRAAAPAALVCLAALPFVVADARLAGRFQVGAEARHRVATPGQAWDQLDAAVRGFAGGSGLALVASLALATLGAVVLAHRERAFLAFALLALVAPPVLATLAPRAGEAPDLSPRHLAYALPLWAALVGVGAARLAERRGLALRGAVVAGVALVVAFGAQTVPDPRGLTYIAPLGSKRLVAPPAQWLRERVQADDLLFPYSSVFLAALPQAGQAHGLPRAEPQPLLDTLRRARFPVKSVFVALPLGHAHGGRIRGRLGAGFEVASFEGWLLVRAHGPFADRDAALRAIRATLAAARPRVGPPQLIAWFDLERSVVGRALAAG